MANPATVTDIENRWRPLSANETIVATTLLADAWTLLTATDMTIDTRLSAVPPTLSANLVIPVLCSMVLRVLKNPDGKAQESIEDYSYTRDRAIAGGALYVDDSELARLTTAVDSGAFTIRLYGAPDTVTT
ncbi:hypothetical protein BH24ACT15_BH24ACT15_37550 [soil metagenome]